MWPSNSTPPSLSQRNENLHAHKNLYMNIRNSLILRAKKENRSKCPLTDKWINVVYLHKGLYNKETKAIKRNKSTDTCYKMNEPGKHHTKGKKHTTKDHVLCFHLLRNVQNMQMHRDRKISRCQRLLPPGWERRGNESKYYCIWVLQGGGCGKSHTTLWTYTDVNT